MMPFMSFDRLGDGLETLYKTIYSGGGLEFGSCINRLVHFLGQLADAGMITNTTKKRIESFFSKEITLSSVKVISRNTSSVVLVNEKIHEQDSFELGDFITYITDELCKDPLMKKKLCGRDNYEGVKSVLNSYADAYHEPVRKESWVDFCIHEDKVFFTKTDGDGGIHLYIQENENDGLPFSGKSNKHFETKVVEDGLLDGRIYYFCNGTVFVENENGYIIRISDLRNGSCRCKRMEGVIFDQLEDESLLCINGGKLIRLWANDNKKVLVEDTFLGMAYTDGRDVFWKSRFRKKDLENAKSGTIEGMSVDRIEDCFKWDKIGEEILWKGLLFTLYDFDCMEFVDKIGNRLRFAYFFDKLPVPFRLDEIFERLSEIEEYCYEGDVIKADGYTEAMSYLMSFEKDNLDKKETMDAIVYLLENVTSNPYERVADYAGVGLLNSIEFCFGDVSKMNDELLSDEDMDELLQGFPGEFDIKEMLDRIDWKIAELEKEEERREKEKAEKAKKKQNVKNSEERQDKGRKSVPDEEKVGRSAEGVNKNSED
jgi:hypothetical protein